MSAANSPHFITSDDENIEHKEGLLTEEQIDQSAENSHDEVEYELPPKQPRLSHTTSRLPAGFGLVSYESEEDEVKNESDITPDVDQPYVSPPRIGLNILPQGPEDTLSSGDEENENGNLPFVISDGALTVLSSEHTLSDVQAVKEALKLNALPQAGFVNSAESTTVVSVDIGSVDSLQISRTLLDEIVLPPEPPGSCDPSLQLKVETVIEHMRHDITYDPNMQIQDNKHFRNPSMYEKLITFLKIDEKGTNFSPDVYNPYRWSASSYYDELSRVQNREIERLEKIRKDQRKADASGLSSSATNQPDIPRAASGPNLISSVDNPPTADSEGSVVTGFAEPRKRSKWDTYVAPPASHSSTEEDPETLELRNIALATKLTIPAVGSLVRKK